MSKLSLSVLRSKNFRILLLTRICVTTALQAQAVIVGWQIYSITKSTFLLGLTGLAEAVPAIAGALVAGHVVDTLGRPHLTYRICLGIILLNNLAFLLFAGGLAPPPGGSLLPWLFGGVFVSGLARSFTAPSSFSLLPRIIAKSELATGTAWITSGWQAAAVTGPAVAGLIYGGYGPRGAWMLPAMLMTAAFLSSAFLRPEHRPRDAQKRESAVKSIQAGWKFILNHPVMFSAMTLDMFAVLFGGATAMLPAYADRILHVGAEGLGALRAAPMLGAVSTALFLALNPMKTLSARRLLWVVAAFGLCTIGFGLSTSFPLSMLLLALSGAFDSVGVVIRNTLLQILTPEDMRGRVSSINTMFVISSNEIGAFESGTAAQLLGLVPSVVAGGIGTLIVVATVALASPKFRRTVVEA